MYGKLWFSYNLAVLYRCLYITAFEVLSEFLPLLANSCTSNCFNKISSMTFINSGS